MFESLPEFVKQAFRDAQAAPPGEKRARQTEVQFKWDVNNVHTIKYFASV